MNKSNGLPSPLCIKLPQIDAYAKYFDKNSKDTLKLMIKNCYKNKMKYGIKLKFYLRKDLKANLCIMIIT